LLFFPLNLKEKCTFVDVRNLIDSYDGGINDMVCRLTHYWIKYILYIYKYKKKTRQHCSTVQLINYRSITELRIGLTIVIPIQQTFCP